MRVLTLCLIFTLSISLTSTATAHNGQLAVAAPVTDITVDGDLSDWPTSANVYQVARAEYGVSPESDEDFKCQFRVGYDAGENAIFAAVEVTDDQLVTDIPGCDWDQQDGCEVYLDQIHARSKSELEQYSWYGERSQTFGSAHRNRVAMEVVRTEGKYVYEWRIKLAEKLESDRSLGFDISVMDKDPDGSFTWMAWGPGIGKRYSADRNGDLLILDSGKELGHVRGNLNMGNDSQDEGRRFPPVVIQSQSNEKVWVQVECDDDGHFSATLPGGSYLAHAADTLDLRVSEEDRTDLAIVAGQASDLGSITVNAMSAPDLIGQRGILLETEFDSSRVDAFLEAYMQFFKIPGLSIAIVKDGDVVYRRGHGVKNLLSQEAVEEETLFEAASMTKPMFAYAVCRLVERGVLDLDTPLYEYLPYSDMEHDDRYKKITARMVLCHRTGFPNWRNGTLELQFEPGTQQQYSGEGFEYLAKVVSHLTNKQTQQVMADEVFKPLDVENTYLTWNHDSDDSLVATPHGRDNGTLSKSNWSHAWVAGCLHIDAGNYANFLTGLINEDGLSKSGFREMYRPQADISKGSDNQNFGLGFIVDQSPFGPCYSHGGHNTGFTSAFEFYPEQRLGYVFLVNNYQAPKLNKALRAFLVTGATGSSQSSRIVTASSR